MGAGVDHRRPVVFAIECDRALVYPIGGAGTMLRGRGLCDSSDLLPAIGIDGAEDDPLVFVGQVAGRRVIKRVRSPACARLASVTIAESAM